MSGFHIYGFLEAFEDDRLLLRTDNLIVDLGLEIVSRIIGNGAGSPTVGGVGFSSLSDIAVTRMILSNRSSPPVPAVTDTAAVLGTVLPARPLTVLYPDDQTIQYVTTIPLSDTAYAGLSIGEEALLTSAVHNHLFARTTFTPITKADPALTFRHTFRFERT